MGPFGGMERGGEFGGAGGDVIEVLAQGLPVFRRLPLFAVRPTHDGAKLSRGGGIWQEIVDIPFARGGLLVPLTDNGGWKPSVRWDLTGRTSACRRGNGFVGKDGTVSLMGMDIPDLIHPRRKAVGVLGEPAYFRKAVGSWGARPSRGVSGRRR